MKRNLPLLLALLLLLTACSPAKKTANPFRFYYRNAEVTYAKDGLIGSEPAPNGMALTPDAVALSYFAGPSDAALVSPFPAGTALKSSTLENGTLSLRFSGELAGAEGVELSLALSCISLTFSQLSGVQSVAISADGALLDGQQELLLEGDKILRSDNSLELAETTLKIYRTDGRYLVPEEIKTKLETVREQAAFAIAQLGVTPESASLSATLPLNTEILDLSIDNGLCILDLSSDFFRNRPQSDLRERLTILSIVDTLTQFDEIDSVQFYVEGQALTTYYHMDLSLIYTRDESAITPGRQAADIIDTTLYLQRENDGQLIAVPSRVKLSGGETESEAVLRTLTEYGSKNGYRSPIPAGTKLLALTERGNYCYLNLSQSFADALQEESAQKTAVRSLVSSIKSLDTINYVSISIEGKSSGLTFVDLNQVF